MNPLDSLESADTSSYNYANCYRPEMFHLDVITILNLNRIPSRVHSECFCFPLANTIIPSHAIPDTTSSPTQVNKLMKFTTKLKKGEKTTNS